MVKIMPVVKVRPKGQVTIPIDILNAWDIHPDDKLNVILVNGIVTLTPINRSKSKQSILSYAGIASGTWGDSAEDIDNFIRNERESWEQ